MIADKELKNLMDVVPTLKISDRDVLEVIDEVQVERFVLKKNEGVLYVYLISEHPIHKRIFDTIEKELTRQITRGKPKVYVIERFRLSSLYSLSYLMQNYRESIKYELYKRSPILASTFANSVIECSDDGKVTVYLPSNVVSAKKGNELITYLDKLFNELTLISI